jgi:hypothetical protein
LFDRAKEAMFFHADTADSPWTVIKSDCKKRARLNAMRYVLLKIPYKGKDVQAIGAVDGMLVGRVTYARDAELSVGEIGRRKLKTSYSHAGRGEHGIQYAGNHRGDGRLAHAERTRCPSDDHGFTGRHVTHSHWGILTEGPRHASPSLESNARAHERRQPPRHAVLDLFFDTQPVDDHTRVHSGGHAIDDDSPIAMH